MPARDPIHSSWPDDSAKRASVLMVAFMCMRLVKVTRGGQISIPAEVRRRWSTSRLRLDDQGHRLILEPGPDDSVAALRGAFANPDKPGSHELRLRARREEQAAEERRARGHGPRP